MNRKLIRHLCVFLAMVMLTSILPLTASADKDTGNSHNIKPTIIKEVNLDELTVIDSKHYQYINRGFVDSFGYTYYGVHYYSDLFNSLNGIHQIPHSTHYLNGKYLTFSGSIVAAKSTNPDWTYFVNIYVDDVLVYSKTGYSKTTGKVDFSVDITNGQKLMISMGLEGNWGDYDEDLGIVNAILTTESSPADVTGTYTTDLTMSAADLGVNAPDALLRATLTFTDDGKASATWEALDVTALQKFFHGMFVNSYYAMAYGAGITDINEIEAYCIESTGMSVSAYMDQFVPYDAIRLAFTPSNTNGTYTYNDDHTAIFTDMPIMDVPSDPAVENSFVIGDNTLYLNAASYGKPDYTFVCTRK